MTRTVAFQRFVEDELKRMPTLARQVINDTLVATSNSLPSSGQAERFKAVDLSMTLRPHRQRLVAAFVDSLQKQFGRLMSTGRSSLPGPGATDASRGLQFKRGGNADPEVLIANCVNQIKGAAGIEVRELTAFVSALAGESQATPDCNPFRPDVMARALWDAAQCLPGEGDQRALFMKMASEPLAQGVRGLVATARNRLEEAGVRPAVYSSTVSEPPAASAPNPQAGGGEDSPPVASTARRLEQGSSSQPAPLRADAGYLGLLNRLFDVILDDKRLADDIKFAISLQQAPALRLAQVDDTWLDMHDHAMWLWLDRIAWQAEVLPEAPHGGRSAVMQAIAQLTDRLTTGSTLDVSAYQWASNSLMASERQRFDQRRQSLVPVISELEALALQSTQPTERAGTAAQALDTGPTDTVPSQLLDTPSTPEARAADERWIASLLPGHVASIYQSGRWVNAQLVWVDPRQDVFLWADCRSDAVWTIKRPELALLQTEALALAHEPRSLVRAAARTVAVQISRSRPA